ncbi:MAG TPA: hypothetical protein VKZ86_10760 [Cyclobacteriaceae bacterium]|nr:hypothetical protein [Cyclobacteriaceae bacterium]
MKVAALAFWQQFITFSACILLLSSCYVYKPIATDKGESGNQFLESIDPGKHYALLVDDGSTAYIKVESVDSDRISGNARIRSDKTTFRSADYSVDPASITSVKEKKISVPRTAGFVAGLGLVGFLAFAGLQMHALSGLAD